MNDICENKLTPLGKVAILQGGFAFSSDSFIYDGIPLIRISNIKVSGLSTKKLVFLPIELLERYPDFKGKAGDTLIAMSGATTGKNALVKKSDLPILINQRVGRFFIKTPTLLDHVYLYYVVNSHHFQNEILKDAIGGAQPNISSNSVEKINIRLPEIRNQKKIAIILTTIDQLIEKTQALIDKHTFIQQGVMNDIFTRGIDLTTGQLRPSFEQASHLYKETELGWIPKSWKVLTIGSSCDVFNNLRKPVSAEEREKIKGDYPYYGCTGVLDYINEFRVDGKYVIIGEDGDHFLKFARQPMTLLIKGKFNVNNHAHIIKGTKTCLTEWFHCYFVNRDITYYLTRQGAGRFKLNKETLLKLPMLVPPIEDQKAIYSRYQTIVLKQECEKYYLNGLIDLKNGLMQDLLTGKVKIS